MIHVSTHSVERYLERVDGRLTFEQARAEIASHERAIEKAAAFGCSFVRLGNGARLVLVGTTVVTVKSRDMRCHFPRNRQAAATPSAAEGRRPDPIAAALIPLTAGGRA